MSARLVQSFTSATLNEIDERAHEIPEEIRPSSLGWVLDDGTEVLRVGSDLHVALPSGEIVQGIQAAEESTKAAVERLLAARKADVEIGQAPSMFGLPTGGAE